VEDSGHSNWECEDWTVYVIPGKSDNAEANAKASNVFQAKTVL
jgi:hypothetical protein